MKFNAKKMKEISRTMTPDERNEIEDRNKNRDWLALSARFALLLRYILRSENMTQTELANRMGVSCARVTKLLSGKENIGLQTIAKVEKAFGRSLVTFGDSMRTDELHTTGQIYTQFFSFPVFCGKSEGFVENKKNLRTYSKLSSDKILV